ncbi:cbb3-type cytochrome c oxidase subunit 3 [Novosphingobium sp. KA1]|uniref:cbb3-type cytochrome c oxidase subunit 3 n=1 Tax=Novosphingobium sp. (strain KA1) TaxID=164608 RepID=UPI001A8F165F|nr:cbb3-type cytochrome c oxidase subunit 3 [Novosphingobium sp. KA1]QSR16776.1 CcoQ/FixQ family Cbb3-type cytochrome c oxidase assembly chaperone [Novosphingobium sp. KA1]
MSTHSTYDMLRHLADSWGLVAMGVIFLVLVAWPFRGALRERNEAAARMIFEDENDG